MLAVIMAMCPFRCWKSKHNLCLRLLCKQKVCGSEPRMRFLSDPNLGYVFCSLPLLCGAGVMRELSKQVHCAETKRWGFSKFMPGSNLSLKIMQDNTWSTKHSGAAERFMSLIAEVGGLNLYLICSSEVCSWLPCFTKEHARQWNSKCFGSVC